MCKHMAINIKTSVAAVLLALYAGPGFAEDGEVNARENEIVMPRVDVIGSEENLPDIVGSAHVIDSEELETSHPFTVNEALRRVPGVNVRDEEGFGIRPNIAIRGLNPTRSTKITLLEDGIPLAYAPYGDNSSYYHPPIDRYDRIEVLKGSGSLLFGPQTLSGVINYITPTPPQEFGGYVQAIAGNREFFNGKLNVGGKGLLLDYSRKEGEGARDNLDHVLDDLNLKYVTALGSNQALTLRANHYTEDSTVTYSGLTEAEFRNLGPRYNPFENDMFNIERNALSATHEYFFGDATLATNVYYARFTRDWWRQSSNSTDSQCEASAPGFVADRLAGIAVDPNLCNSAQGRLRDYVTWGIEPRLTVVHGLGEFQAGVRFHSEEQDRQQINATSPTGRIGTLVEDNLRDTEATSFFLANRFDIGDFSVTPIVRYESIDFERTNELTNVTGSDSLSETIPGIGITWNPVSNLTVFSSVHEGFAPPRVEDLIGGTGTVTEVDPEKSTNFELGVRAQPLSWAALQAAYFRSDFDNLVAVGSIAAGSTPLSEGEALFEGFELSAQADHDSGVFGRLAYTYLPTAEQSEPFRGVATGDITAGSARGLRQPYAPEQTVTAAAGYGVGRFRGEIEVQFIDEQFSDFANTVTPTPDGQRGVIDSATVWNAALNYQLLPNASIFATVKNLADNTFIVDRTRGIQTGIPRLVQVGARYDF